MDLLEAQKKISDVVSELGEAGFSVWISNECCGCSRMSLQVSPEGGDGSTALTVPGV